MNYWIDYKVNKNLKYIGDLLYELCIDKFNLTTEVKRTKLRQAIYCLILNSHYYIAFNTKHMVVPLYKNDYSKPLIYNGRKVNRQVSYEYTMRLFEWLDDNCYCNLTRGGVNEWTKDKNDNWIATVYTQSVLHFNQPFLDLFKGSVEGNKDIQPHKDVIVIRDSNKNKIQKKLPPEVEHIRDVLLELMVFYKEVEVECEGETVYIKLSKIYNNSSFEHGGRSFVIGEANKIMKKIKRKHIKVNGEATVELDYASIHPRLVATILGVKLPIGFDPYGIEVEGYHPEPLRCICKLLVLCMFNANSRMSAIMAVNNELNKETIEVDGKEIPLMKYWRDQGMIPNKSELGRISDELLKHNPYMIDKAYTGCGLELQNLDSRVMDIILEDFVLNKEFVLPVHDSIIIRESIKDYGLKLMEDAFEQVMGTADNCVIK